MSDNEYLKDLSEIKNIMNRSTKFISLSGLSGILAGVYAIIGALVAKVFLFNSQNYYNDNTVYLHSWQFKLLIVILAAVALLSLFSAYFLSAKKAKKNGEKIWNDTSKRMLVNFLIPFVTGGLYILIKLNSQHYGLTASLMLIFYGLALVNASKYTVGTIKYLGLSEIVLGLICAMLPGYGFTFWILGFGILHIVYGVVMYRKEK